VAAAIINMTTLKHMALSGAALVVLVGSLLMATPVEGFLYSPRIFCTFTALLSVVVRLLSTQEEKKETAAANAALTCPLIKYSSRGRLRF
jgi:hypothetical protein